jgi:exodeoxyribonuclease VII large subunit
MRPREGMRVIALGSVSLYTAAGQYQFYVDSLRDDGVGSLYIAFEKLKAKLLAEGLFDPSLKKPLPLLPRGIGIVTSKTGAAVHDIKRVSSRRHPGVRLYLAPAAVQGENAPAELIRGLQTLEKCGGVDVIIIGRGGGSLEELRAFNDEGVARAIFVCEKPVISAVGHETDFTIADFVADVRAATPSNAAELAVPELTSLHAVLRLCMDRLRVSQRNRLSLLFGRLRQIEARLMLQKPSNQLREFRRKADALMSLAGVRIESTLIRKRLALKELNGRLTALSPEKVLERGYALVTREDRSLLTDAKQTSTGEKIRIALRGGALQAKVTEVFYGRQEKAD